MKNSSQIGIPLLLAFVLLSGCSAGYSEEFDFIGVWNLEDPTTGEINDLSLYIGPVGGWSILECNPPDMLSGNGRYTIENGKISFTGTTELGVMGVGKVESRPFQGRYKLSGDRLINLDRPMSISWRRN